jgi:hypothetical protein
VTRCAEGQKGRQEGSKEGREEDGQEEEEVTAPDAVESAVERGHLLAAFFSCSVKLGLCG